MSRKKHLDYFPLEVHLDEKIELLEAEYGLKGFAIIIKLYQRIYGGEGYFCKWNEEVALLFSKSINEGCSAVSEIVKSAVKRGLFNERLFKQYGILTSSGIQKRYINVVKSLKRTQIEIEEPFRLISPTEKCEPTGENRKNYGENSKNYGENAIKEKKGKESKLKENKIKEKKAYGEYSRVYLTNEEYSKLGKEYPNRDEIIKFLDEYIEMKGGYDVKSHYVAIHKWVATAVEEQKKRIEKLNSTSTKRGPLNNFKQDNPDFEAIEKVVLARQRNF